MTDEEDLAPPSGDAENPLVPFDERFLPKARVSDELLTAGRDARPGRVQRHDGWTPERIRTFLHALAACGVVSDAARAAGMSVRSAYYLRNRAQGGAFNIAWNAAQQLARRRLADAVASRAVHGCVEVVMRDGEVWGERHRYDNRLTMAVLTRADRIAESNDDESRAARFALQEFDEFVETVCRGGQDAAAFIASRERAESRPALNDAARNLERLEHYRRHGAGLPESAAEAEVDADVEPDDDDPVDRTASLAAADNAEAVRRYFRWKDASEDPGSSDE